MPKGQQRSNREKKKSKQPKKFRAPVSPFPTTQAPIVPPDPGKKA